MMRILGFFGTLVGSLAIAKSYEVGDDYANGVKEWDAYVKSLPSNIQDRCVPQRYPYKGDTYKGVVMMVHGFSACPNQYNELAGLVAAEGYDVLTPLLPGHGRKTINGHDDTAAQSFLAQDYNDLGARLSTVVSHFPGSHRLAGISVGGALAAFMGTQTNGGKAVFQRQLIMNPMFALPDANCANPLNQLLSGVQHSKDPAMKLLFNSVKDYELGWGEGCEFEMAHGRGGFCNSTAGSGHAAYDFGATTLDATLAAAEQPGLDTTLQVIYTERDLVSNVGGTRKYFEHMSKGHSTTGSMCAMYTPIGHSFLSPFDTPSDNKYWLNEMLCRISTYLSAPEGQHTSIEQAPEGHTTDDKDPYCLVTCTEKTCPWTQAKDLHFPPSAANKLCPSYEPGWVPAHKSSDTTLRGRVTAV